MTTATAPILLQPTNDPRPVEYAIADGILDNFEPETLLWITIPQPDGGLHVHYRWTAGGEQLGDRIDQAAVAAGYDSADWLHLIGRHSSEHYRGRIKIMAHLLRPIEADVHHGRRAPKEKTNEVRRIITAALELSGRADNSSVPVVPRWAGVGPALLTGR